MRNLSEIRKLTYDGCVPDTLPETWVVGPLTQGGGGGLPARFPGRAIGSVGRLAQQSARHARCSLHHAALRGPDA